MHALVSFLAAVAGGDAAGPSTAAPDPLALDAPTAAPQEPAAAPAAPDGWGLDWTWKDGIRLEAANGNFRGKFGGRIQFDASFLDVDDELEAGLGVEDDDGAEFRRARLYFEGSYYDWFWKAQYDFAGDVGGTDDRPGFNDVYLGHRDVLREVDAKAGHFKEPVSLQELTSSKYVTFLERSLPVQAFAPARNDGVAIHDDWDGERGTWTLGAFRPDTDGAGFAQEDGVYAGSARVTFLPWVDEDEGALVHTGLSYSVRGGDARFRARPEVHLSDRLVDTGAIAADGVALGGLELAAAAGPVHAAAEYLMASVDAESGSDPDFDGYYVQLGWFLTGETRPYKTATGTWDRVRPLEAYEEGGRGAIEAAVRWSAVDLADAGIDGGEEENLTLALNWYPNAVVRFGANWVLGTVESDAAGVDDDVSALLLRAQVAW